MGSIKQSVVLGCFARDGVSPEMVIDEAARVGFDSVEMLDRQYFGRVRDLGMRVAVTFGHESLREGLNDRRNHDRIEQELFGSIEMAAAHDIGGLICFSGNRAGRSDEEGRDNTVEGLLRVVRMAEERGVFLLLELLNSNVDHPDYQCDSTHWGIQVCRALSSPNVKLLYDIYHMQIMEGNLIRTIKDNIDLIGHFHTAGNPGRNDLDQNQEIAYPPIMRAIAETDYDLYVGHEFTPKGEPLLAMKVAYETCNVKA